MRTLGMTVLALLCAAGLASPALALPEVGKPAPDFTVTTFDGKDIHLKDLKGQVVVVNFWATWCGPCKRELPLLDLYYKVQKKFGLAVVAVTTEDSIEPYKLEPLAKVLTIPLARRFRGNAYKEPEAVPTNYVIDRNGVVRYAKAGSLDLEAMNSLLIPLLKETAPNDVAPAVAAAKTAAR